MWWLPLPRRSQTKLTPQASCSKRGWYKPCGAGKPTGEICAPGGGDVSRDLECIMFEVVSLTGQVALEIARNVVGRSDDSHWYPVAEHPVRTMER